MDDLGSTLREHGIAAKNFRRWGLASEEIYLLDTVKSSALLQWQRLRALVNSTGYWPIILGDEEGLTYHEEQFTIQDAQNRSILNEAASIDAEAWLDRQWEEMWSYEDARDMFHIPWPDNISPNTDFETISRTSEAVIGLVPARYSWHIPVHLRYGGWNANPTAAEHTAVHKYWQNLYQTEIVIAMFDTLELRVGKPPHTRQDALKLAQQQMAYCEDIVTQGMGSIEALAATLLNGTVWYFWWD
jgi:hypothetical protein